MTETINSTDTKGYQCIKNYPSIVYKITTQRTVTPLGLDSKESFRLPYPPPPQTSRKLVPFNNFFLKNSNHIP